MKMFQAILQYIRDWFPSNELPISTDFSRKRRNTDNYNFRSPKHRKILSSVTNNIIEDDYFASPLKSSVFRHFPGERTVVIDDDEDDRPATKPIDIKVGRDRKSPDYKKTNGNDDLSFLKTIKSTTEKRLDAKKTGFEYITRFSSGRDPATPKSPNMQNGTKPKSKISPILKNPPKARRSFLNDSMSSPTLDYSIRLDDKKKYQMLLENAALQNNFSNSFNSSVYGTPVGSLNRSRRLVEMARSPKQKPFEIIDLTNENKTKLSTKDRVIKVLDDFESETAVIEDSDSDVEILPSPPSPKPDIKVSPVNTLKPVIETSKATHHKWLEDITKKHEQYVVDKSKEIQAYEENSSTLNEINRNLLIKSLTKKVQDSLAIKDAILPVVEEEEEVELPQLTDEHLRLVQRAFSGDPNEVLTKKFNLNVNRRDMKTLSGLNWLNDNVINFYMNLIIERGTDPKWPRAYAMNTFFYQKLSTSGPESLKRWTRKVDLFSYDFICVPIHLGMHWCMAIINLKEKSIKYYDSMGKSNNQCLNALRGYLEFEHQDKKKEPYSTKDFLVENVQDIPQQMNGSDCGMFACTFAEFATRRAKFTFQQEDMPYLRKKMVVEILTGQLLIQ